MDKTLETILSTGVVAVLRAKSSAELMNVVRALSGGGVKAIEVTMTTPGALKLIEEVSEQMADEVVVGVGSVLDAETARLAILAGAQFVVGPVLSEEVIHLCKRYSKLVCPGAFTPTEILRAWELGADVVKVFPATAVGPKYFRDVLAPLPQVKLIPTGGVSVENTADFIRAGASAVAAGSCLVDKKAVAERRWNIITETAKRMIAEVKRGREG
ncbi:MAG: 2-dehydro-3-deoxyphosphogluconate aldolase [Candidatus Latescibacterota bacterium]|nr:MAG: 2-dehydro-3-deoxyphosphogluconate aldolase [Candidatus Latescibacterota bacterium]